MVNGKTMESGSAHQCPDCPKCCLKYKSCHAQRHSNVSEMRVCCSAVRAGRWIGTSLAEREHYTESIMLNGTPKYRSQGVARKVKCAKL
ncbi:MAG: hypothetical protein WC721_05685 [Victivallaceae bacterium]